MKTLMRLMALTLLLSVIFVVSKKTDGIQASKNVAITSNAREVSHADQYALTYEEEVALKYMYGTTIMRDCTGRDKKLINGRCQTGRRVNDQSTRGSGGRWYCYFYYEFSDGSTNGPYSETNMAPCVID
jgi:hypothetical protein